MATVSNTFQTGNHAGRPTSGLAYGALYACSTHALIYQTTDGGGTWVTWATLGTTETRASLGLATSDTPQFTGIEVGNASDTTLARASAGVLQVEGNRLFAVGGTDVPVADGGTGASTALAGFNALSPVTTRGDLITRDATNNVRLAIGSAGMVLQTINGTDPVWGYSAPILGCKVYNSTTQSFNATTLTTITYDSEEYDTATMHDTSSNTGRLVAPVTGKYCVKAGIWYATTSGTNYVLFDKNGAGVYIRGGALSVGGDASGCMNATDVDLTAGDYITVVGYHTQAGSIATGDTGGTPSQQNWATMHLIGI